METAASKTLEVAAPGRARASGARTTPRAPDTSSLGSVGDAQINRTVRTHTHNARDKDGDEIEDLNKDGGPVELKEVRDSASCTLLCARRCVSTRSMDFDYRFKKLSNSANFSHVCVLVTSSQVGVMSRYVYLSA